MRIGIDARPLIQRKSGIGVYIENILKFILKKDSEHEYILISDSDIFFDSESEKVRKYIYHPNTILPNTFYFELSLAKRLKRDKIDLDVFWGTQQFMPIGLGNKCRKILTIHDLAYKLYPETVNKKVLFMLRMFAQKSIQEADEIISVSKYTKKKLLEIYPNIADKKVNVIYEAGNVDSNNTNYISSIDNGISMFLLYIGIIEPRKNLDVLMDAYDVIKKNTSLNLVICGKYGWNSEETMRRITDTAGIYYLNYVSDADKAYLLKKCFAFIMPSKYEGFGIPVVEAMQSGSIAIVADNSSLCELVEENALKFETMSYNSLARKVIEIYKDKELYMEMKNYCSRRGKIFSWEMCAGETLKVLGKS